MFAKQQYNYDKNFVKEWTEHRKNKAAYIFGRGVLRYGLPLGVVIAAVLYFTESIPTEPIAFAQIVGLFSIFGIIRGWYRFNFFERKYQEVKNK